MKNIIENFVLNASYGDVLNYKKQNKKAIVESYEVNQWSYIVEIMLITIKSLKPSQDKDGNIIDYVRFKRELELWKYYRHGMNKNLLYSMDKDRYECYFNEIDESIYARMGIITLANQNWNIIKDEVIKNILFSMGSLEAIIESLLLAKILFLKLQNKNIEYEDLLIDIKQEAINFSPLEVNLDDKNSKIEFERLRVSLITKLNGVNIDNRFPILMNCLKIMESGVSEAVESTDNFFVVGLIGMINGEVTSRDIKDIEFLISLSAYLVKLRKGRITLESFKAEDYKDEDIFSYNEEDQFIHPLLNLSQVIYKECRQGFKIVYLKTRTGIYRFVKKCSYQYILIATFLESYLNRIYFF